MLEKLTNKKRVCPWWLCFTFDNPLRRIFHDPIKILSPYVHEGDTAIDIGPGMGFFSIPMAQLAGARGRVIAIDIQPKMLSALESRAHKKGISRIIKTHLANRESIGIHQKSDFVLAFWIVHEVPDQRRLFSEIRNVLKPKGLFLMVEPKMHVSMNNFSRTLETAQTSGLYIREFPKISMSRSVLFTRDKNGLRQFGNLEKS